MGLSPSAARGQAHFSALTRPRGATIEPAEKSASPRRPVNGYPQCKKRSTIDQASTDASVVLESLLAESNPKDAGEAVARQRLKYPKPIVRY